MFIPLGFGHKPKKFPISIAATLLAVVLASIYYFPILAKIEKDLNKKSEAAAKVIGDQSKILISDVCLVKFNDKDLCSTKPKDKKSAKKPDISLNKISLYSDFANFLSEFRKELKDWPLEARQHKLYPQILKARDELKDSNLATHGEVDILTSRHVTPVSLIVSTLIHADWMHLIGNMLLFVLLGLWVEQKIGFRHTTMVFFVGSFLGLWTNVFFEESQPILGASAGVSAIMGAFFIFFYKKEFIFLFMGGILFKRVSLPIIWTFPFLYFATDIIALAEGSKDGIGHIAHFTGLVFGLFYGAWQIKAQNLQDDELFPQERILAQTLSTTTSRNQLWTSFREIMSWNGQNQKAFEMFLKRGAELKLVLTKPQQIAWLEKIYVRMNHRNFKNDELGSTLKWVRLIPDYLSAKNCMDEIPLNHLLSLADILAKKNDWKTSLKLYEAALLKKPNTKTHKRILEAISAIKGIQEEAS